MSYFHTHALVTPTGSTSNLSFGVIAGIVVAVLIVFLVLIISIVSCVVYASRVQRSRIRRGTAAASSNLPATTLTSSSAHVSSSSNFTYAPLPQKPPPPYPGSLTDDLNPGQTQAQLQAQQPVSSYGYPQEYPTQQGPYYYDAGAPYPQPTAELEGAAPSTLPLLHSTEPDNKDNDIVMQPVVHFEARQAPGEHTAPTIASVPDQLSYSLSDLPPTAGVASYPKTTTAVVGDSDTNPQPPRSN